MAKLDVNWWLDHVPEHSDDPASLRLMQFCTQRQVHTDTELRAHLDLRHGPSNPIAADWDRLVRPHTAQMTAACSRIDQRLSRFTG